MRIATVVTASAGLLALMGGTAVAAPADTSAPAPADRKCEGVKLSGSLPLPPAGMAVQQQVTIGEDCKPVLGEVRYVPATGQSAKNAVAAAPAATAEAAGSRTVRSWNEMYDCCNIRMTGLYTNSTWDTVGGQVTNAASTARQEWNREPWNAGWSLKSSSATGDANYAAHADFTYKGIFDLSGDRYANSHHTYVKLNGDGTSTCTFDVELKSTFIGWNWQRGCA
ncbi:hypothetical protein OHS33_12760 [Streptomyces sp. NBC_00536]|uniref:hypothetical protein n=1 Tax=Streptomyces sp. NBC_00536 TaxID=2975769 RepID=UPI002E807FAB|nr:hypothetical protein [Streptomyces sp. NBC_00536]WUC79135.1 hypothetical protein OHS33_12760 [Streptomyces sp. NBC_00536]